MEQNSSEKENDTGQELASVQRKEGYPRKEYMKVKYMYFCFQLI